MDSTGHKYHLLGIICLFMLSCNQNHQRKFEILGRLQGSWESTSNIQFQESWTMINDSTLKGIGFNLNQGDTVFSEQLYIQYHTGQISYVAVVSNQNDAKAVVFQLVKSSGKRFVFENAGHDYPNRIIYKFLSDSVLHVRIETMQGTKGTDFNLKRTNP